MGVDHLDTKSFRQVVIEKADTENPRLSTSDVPSPYLATTTSYQINAWQFLLIFFGGVLACLAAQNTISHLCSGPNDVSSIDISNMKAYKGKGKSHFPPSKPTNVFPSLFPTDVGYGGSIQTGIEAGIVATAPAYPQHTGAPGLLLPQNIKGSSNASFDMFKSWGNLSPWFTVPSAEFGLPNTSPNVPEQCRVTGLHLLHRHGAKYPAGFMLWGGPDRMRKKYKRLANLTATGELEFLNDWSYVLGDKILTPFGRHQMYDLGVSMRMRYGFLLRNFTKTNTLPVFRTDSMNRILHSTINFALGFFGYPIEKQYQQLIMLRTAGINNTLSPAVNCPNAYVSDRAERGAWYMEQWANIYLKDALARFQILSSGVEWSIEDIFSMQALCPYETLALGYSSFCALFTQKEWEGFHYALDLELWYNDMFGSPMSLALGAGWVKEMVARLTHTPVTVHDSTTNSTLHNPIQFPLNDALYVDATHGSVFMKILTAMNLTQFRDDEPLPWTHIPPNRKFKSSRVGPLATNIQIQLLSCTTHSEPQLRVILNDGVVPLNGLEGCPTDKNGMCPVDTFVAAQRAGLKQVDFKWTCHGDWNIPPGPGWNTTKGIPPPKPGTRLPRIGRVARRITDVPASALNGLYPYVSTVPDKNKPHVYAVECEWKILKDTPITLISTYFNFSGPLAVGSFVAVTGELPYLTGNTEGEVDANNFWSVAKPEDAHQLSLPPPNVYAVGKPDSTEGRNWILMVAMYDCTSQALPIRAKKCDRIQPVCERCKKGGFICLGYDQPESLNASRSLRTLVSTGATPPKCHDVPKDCFAQQRLQIQRNQQTTSSTSVELIDAHGQPDVASAVSTATLPTSYSPVQPVTPNRLFRGSQPTLAAPSTDFASLDTPTHAQGLTNQYLPLSGTQSILARGASHPDISLLPRLHPLPEQWRENFGLVMTSYEKLVGASFFEPVPNQMASTRGIVIRRLQNSRTGWCMFLAAQVFEAILKDPEARVASLVKYHDWIERFERRLNFAILNGYIPPQDLSDRLELTLLKVRTSNRINTYQLLQEQAPTFLQIVFSDPTFWSHGYSSMKVSLAHVLASNRYEITHFALLDMMCSMAYGLPQAIDYDTSMPPLNGYHPPVDWINGCPLQLQRIIVKINALCAWNSIGPVPNWLPIEQELREWEPPARTVSENESWKSVARLAVQESWRHALLVYLYTGVCGVASDDPRVISSVKQVFRIIDTVRNESRLISHLHFANQYLIAGAYTPNEKQRAIARQELSALMRNGLWLLNGSDFVPVLDHLWHGAGANGRPVKRTRVDCELQICLNLNHLDTKAGMEKLDAKNGALVQTSGATPLCLSDTVHRRDNHWRFIIAFAGGALACVAAQHIAPHFCYESHSTSLTNFNGKKGHFPPSKPTNVVPSLFPTNVGYLGPTPTGIEAGMVATAPSYPQHTGAPGLLLPQKIKGSSNASFDMFKSWGNLSPWYTVPSGDFGLPDASPNAPEQCRVIGLHVLYRHGAKYPAGVDSWGGPTRMRKKFKKSKFTGAGELEFLNDWSYPLGQKILTSFGRAQMYTLGVSLRMRYGFLLQNFMKTNTLPVFRVDSQDRVLQSSINFGFGFFGNPIENQYQQLIMLKATGVNSTLSPARGCPNASTAERSGRGTWYKQRWAEIYLKDALARIKKSSSGVKWTIEDVFSLQMLCPYETVALGYSKFCELFTQEEWEGFNYAADLENWYNDLFGSPVTLAHGAGWVTEMVARLTHAPVTIHNTTTNSTLHNSIQFPLNDALYVDFTHGSVFFKILAAMNLTRFREEEPLPWTHIPSDRKFRSSQVAPLGANMKIQLLSCATQTEPQLRVILNDGVVPLDDFEGCPANKDGMCSVKAFVAAQRMSLKQADYEWTCRGDWEVPPGPGWNTTMGMPPTKPGIA